jgi:tetratricopeptide (TPR) repeat protein
VILTTKNDNFLLRIVHISRPALVAMSLLLISLSLQAGVQPDKVQSLISEGKLRQALSLTNKQLLEDEGNVTFRFLKGLILTRLNELDKARDLFVELTREHPDLPEPYNNLAVIYASQGDFEKARDALLQAISTHPSYATAHENMGDIYAKMASKAYNQALELDADNTSAKAKLSLINDLFFVPKRKQSVVKTVAAVEPEPEPKPKPVVVEPAPVVTPAPAPVPEPKTALVKPAQRDVLAEQKEAKKAIEEKKRAQEKLKSAVAATIDEWAKAWSAKDAVKYITYYGKDFTPPKKLSRAAWESQRKVRLAKPRFINIKVSKLKISMLGDDHARAEFRQSYQSDTYADEVGKALILKKVADKWLITQEQSK